MTYGGVDRLISLETAVVLEPMVGLAKGDARKAVGQEAEVDGVEAVEETSSPWLGAGRRLGVDVLARLAQDLVHSLLPVLDILVIDRAVVVALRSRHYVLV